MKKKSNSPFPEPWYIVDKTGKKIEVVLGIKAYDHLVEIIEDFALVDLQKKR